MMKKIHVFDPPLCCPTGVCGPSVDPTLVRFAADLEWLEGEGVEVARHNLAQEPTAFAEEPAVAAALKEKGNDCLPLVLAGGAIVSRARYPSRAELLAFAGIESLYSEAVEELVAIGAAIASNCETCFKHHYGQALKLGVSRDDMTKAVRTARMVKSAPATAVLDLAGRYLKADLAAEPAPEPPSVCCGGEPTDVATSAEGGTSQAGGSCAQGATPPFKLDLEVDVPGCDPSSGCCG